MNDKLTNTLAWILGDFFLFASGILKFSLLSVETIFFGVLGGASAVVGKKLIEYAMEKMKNKIK